MMITPHASPYFQNPIARESGKTIGNIIPIIQQDKHVVPNIWRIPPIEGKQQAYHPNKGITYTCMRDNGTPITMTSHFVTNLAKLQNIPKSEL